MNDKAPRKKNISHDVSLWTDRYFLKTKETVKRFGDKRVTYAVFMRRPVVSAPTLMVDWLKAAGAERESDFDIEINYPEGDWVGAGEPLLYITGSFYHLVDLETLYLQKLGAACVAAHNAYTMCLELPEVGFLGDGCAALYRPGNGRVDGLRRFSRLEIGSKRIGG